MVSGHSALHGLQGPGQSQGHRDEMDFRVMWDAAGLRVFHSEGSMLSSQYKQMYTSVPHDTQVDAGLETILIGWEGALTRQRGRLLLCISHFPGAWRDGQAVLIFKPHVLNAY